jgi:hypothetical protein
MDIVIVSGLPRSGTSLMMKMLAAGGLPVLSDGQRAADADNPEGYFEFERVKALKDGDAAWLADAGGKVVKVISALLQQLPAGRTYKVIFMRRRLAEVLASQRRMLIRRGESAGAVPDARLAEIFEKHLRQVNGWLARQPHIATLHVDYNALVADPLPGAEAVSRFLGGSLDPHAMAAAVRPELYRNRSDGVAD